MIAENKKLIPYIYIIFQQKKILKAPDKNFKFSLK